MRKSNLVTLFVLVALLAVSVASVSAAPSGKVSICHVPPGNPNAAHVINIGEAGWRGHLNHEDDFDIDENHPCPPVSDDGGDGDDGDDDDTGEVCEWDETLPADSDLCVPPDDGNDDDNTGGDDVDPGNIVAEAPAPALVQITVWPDTFQVANLTGFTWTIDGNPIYDDRNNNGVMDTGERIVTAVEVRNRPVCGEPGPSVPNQPMSRLVLSITRDEIPGGDLDAFLSRFQAQINGVPVTWGWYDINGEFAPCQPAFDGVTQHRQGQ